MRIGEIIGLLGRRSGQFCTICDALHFHHVFFETLTPHLLISEAFESPLNLDDLDLLLDSCL